MKLPSHQQARVPQAKVVKYLLSSTHRAGKSKAAWFLAHGFRVEEWTELAQALQEHADTHSASQTQETLFGTR